MKYHRRFNNISPFTVRRTRWLIRRWSVTDDRWAAMRAWLVIVSERYRMVTPNLVNDRRAGSGYYRRDTNTIYLSKPSIITLLHEFRHAMQSQGAAGPSFRPDRDMEERGGVEDDARAWSLSLYYAVAPRTLKRLVSEGRVFHTSPADFR